MGEQKTTKSEPDVPPAKPTRGLAGPKPGDALRPPEGADGLFRSLYARNIIDSSLDMIVAVDPERRIVEFNRAAQETFGYTEDEVLGRHVHMLYADEEEGRKVSREVLEKGSFVGEITNVCKNGRRFTSLLSASVMRDEGGRVIGVVGNSRDITEEKRAKEALRESEERYHSLYDQAPDMYFTVSPEGTVTSVNRYGACYLGYSKEELLGRPVAVVVHPEDRKEVKGQMTRLISHRMPKSELRFRKVRKDGSTLWVDERLSLVLDERGEPVELRIICRDITEQKLAQERLVASLGEKEALLREIHHRVKNNLQIISSLLDLSSMGSSGRGAEQSLIEARARVHTMAQIHSQLYSSDRFDRIEMGAHARDLLSHLASLYFTRDREVECLVESGRVYLPVDRAIPCALALNEAISNSFRHAFTGRAKGKIEVFLEARGPDGVFISVKDDGVGISRDMAVDRSGGLGLKLLSTLVERQLGGEFRVTREGGTLIEIEFQR